MIFETGGSDWCKLLALSSGVTDWCYRMMVQTGAVTGGTDW